MNLLPAWWRARFILAELGASVIATSGFIGWVECLNGSSVIDGLLIGNRGPVYGALATIFGTLLGFTITAASIVLGFSSSPRLRVVRESTQYPTLWKVFGSTIRALALATIVALIALIVDRDSMPRHWALYLVVFGFLLSSVRIARAIWALENVIALVTRPDGT